MSSIVVKNRSDLINLINEGKINIPVAKSTILLALGGIFLDAYDFGNIGIGVIQLQEALHLTAIQISTISAALAFGALFGALFGGRIVDSIGRFEMFLIDMFLFVIGAIGAAVSVNLYMLIAFRFLMGIGVGIDFPAALSLIAEYSHINSKGKNVNFWQAMWYISTVLLYLLAYLLYLNYSIFGINIWRYIIGFSAIPAAIIIILRYRYMSESPLWIFLRGSIEDIRKYLERLGITYVKLPDKLDYTDISYKTFKTLFSRKYLKRTITASALSIAESLEYFAVGFYLPLILLALYHGAVLKAILATAVLNTAGIIGGVSESLVTHRFGIRNLALVGLFMVFTTLLIIGFLGSKIGLLASTILLFMFILFHSFGPGPQGMTMAVLSYPTSIRGTGTGFTQGMLRVGSLIGFYAFPLLKVFVGLYMTLIYIALAPLIAFIIVLLSNWEPLKVNVDNEDFEDKQKK